MLAVAHRREFAGSCPSSKAFRFPCPGNSQSFACHTNALQYYCQTLAYDRCRPGPLSVGCLLWTSGTPQGVSRYNEMLLLLSFEQANLPIAAHTDSRPCCRNKPYSQPPAATTESSPW